MLIALVIAVPFLYFSERSGVYVTDDGIRCVPLSGKPFSYSWDRISGFSVRSLGSQLAVFVDADDGSRALPRLEIS
jgi:hypothetical protein